jgi:hypothetical protein
MTENHPLKIKRWGPYTTLGGEAQAGNDISLHMKPLEKSQPNQAVEDKKDRDDQVEKPRHDQDQKAGDDGYDRRDMSDGEGHKHLL